MLTCNRIALRQCLDILYNNTKIKVEIPPVLELLNVDVELPIVSPIDSIRQILVSSQVSNFSLDSDNNNKLVTVSLVGEIGEIANLGVPSVLKDKGKSESGKTGFSSQQIVSFPSAIPNTSGPATNLDSVVVTPLGESVTARDLKFHQDRLDLATFPPDKPIEGPREAGQFTYKDLSKQQAAIDRAACENKEALLPLGIKVTTDKVHDIDKALRNNPNLKGALLK
jgi:hypothetical protein